MKTQSIYKILTVVVLLAISFGAQAAEVNHSALTDSSTKISVGSGNNACDSGCTSQIRGKKR